MSDWSVYLTKKETGLPFFVEKDNHFANYRALHDNHSSQILTVSDLININILVELKKLNKKNKTKA